MKDRERNGRGMMGSDFYNSSRSGSESNWDRDNSFTFGSRGSTYGDSSRGHDYGDRGTFNDNYRLRNQASREAWNDNDRSDSSDYFDRNRSTANRNRSSYGHDRDWTDRTGDEVKSWFGDDDAERRRHRDERRDDSRDNSSWFSNDRDRDYRSNRRDDNDSWFGRESYSPSTRDHYDNSRTIDSGRYDNQRYNTSNDNYTGYGPNRNNDNSWFNSDDDRRRSGSYSASSRYDDDDRGFFDRAGDEVRSWFGDDEAERRRRMDDVRDYSDDRNPDQGQSYFRKNTFRGENDYRRHNDRR